MIVADFLQQVKQEGRVEGDTNFDVFIVNTLNELIVEAVMQERIPELRVLNFPLDIPIGLDSVSLPPDYLKMYKVRYQNFATDKTWVLNDGTGVVEPCPPGFYGFPKFYAIVGQQILIRPIIEITADDTLSIDYYQKPNQLLPTEPDTEILPNRLVPFLIRQILARLKIYHDKPQEAQFHMQDAARGAKAFVEEQIIDKLPE